MKFTLSWLCDHLETESPLEDLLETLTLIGLEVEEVINPADALEGFVVGEVISAKKHPNADKLTCCTVDIGTGLMEIVCGATNARTGMKGVFAPVGTYVPGIDVTLTKAKIRGVSSHGMLCSERELQISDEHQGIVELPLDAKVGESYAELMNLDDPMIEIAITPNRPDCLGVRGIARDLAAAGLGELKVDKVGPVKGQFECPISIGLNFPKSRSSACPVFFGRLIRGVKNGPSPDWLARRLQAIGLRPINALADITNYVSYDRARPLHVYDADKLQGSIGARLGIGGESFLALDGKTYEVDAEMCVIADDSAVLGLGGVIGGEETSVTSETVNVFIESAYFDPVRTAMTGRKLNLISDARTRFERGIDPGSVDLGVDMATALILEILDGEPSTVERAGSPPEKTPPINFDPDEVRRLTGVSLEGREIKTILKKLGFGIDDKGGALEVDVPNWRPDVSLPADLVEEVVRIMGVDRVPVVPMKRDMGCARPVLTEGQKRLRRVRRILASRGMVEVMSWGFIPEAQATLFGGAQEVLTLANPISTDMSSMRPSLLPGLLTAAQRNRDRGVGDLALFEVSQIYRGDQADAQIIAASGIRMGRAKLARSGRHWSGDAEPVTLFDAKGDALSILTALGLDVSKIQVVNTAPDWFHPGRAGSLHLGPQICLAHFGEFHPTTLKALNVSGPIVGFELFLDSLPRKKRKTRTKSALKISDLQAVSRDFAFVLDRDVPASHVVRAAHAADKELITDVRLFDLFEGEILGQDKKSLAIEVTLQPRLKTLTDEEIEAVAEKVIVEVKKATGGEVRT